MTDDETRARQTESKRILERVSREADSSGGLVGRMTRRTRDHVAAADVDRSDWAEYWGSRIGRGLGVVITVALIIWLVVFVFTGA